MEEHSDDLIVLARVLGSLVLAACLGWERERAERPAGLRTHMLVALAATVLVGVGPAVVQFMNEADVGEHASGIRFDPLRLVEAVMTGVAFLGAGTIFVRRDRHDVQGLTTAASLLATAAIGIAVGVGEYVLAVGSTALVLLALTVMKRFGDRHRDDAEDEDAR